MSWDWETGLYSKSQVRSLTSDLPQGAARTRSTVVTAVKFTIVDQPAPIDSLLKECIGNTHSYTWTRRDQTTFLVYIWSNFPLPVVGDFLKTLQDEDLNVRRVALVMFNSAAHNKPSLIRGLLGALLPHLYQETKIRKDLIREVRSHLLKIIVCCQKLLR